MADSIKRDEAPFASHGLYTQKGVLDDKIPEERALGINAGSAWGAKADYVVVYGDLGLSGGMVKGIRRALAASQMVYLRFLDSQNYLNFHNELKDKMPDCGEVDLFGKVFIRSYHLYPQRD